MVAWSRGRVVALPLAYNSGKLDHHALCRHEDVPTRQ